MPGGFRRLHRRGRRGASGWAAVSAAADTPVPLVQPGCCKWHDHQHAAARCMHRGVPCSNVPGREGVVKAARERVGGGGLLPPPPVNRLPPPLGKLLPSAARQHAAAAAATAAATAGSDRQARRPWLCGDGWEAKQGWAGMRLGPLGCRQSGGPRWQPSGGGGGGGGALPAQLGRFSPLLLHWTLRAVATERTAAGCSNPARTSPARCQPAHLCQSTTPAARM